MIKHLLNAPQSLSQTPVIAAHTRNYGLNPADRLIEPIFQTSISKHNSIYLGIDALGTELIAENHKFNGVRLVKATDFFRNKNDITVEGFSGEYRERVAAVKWTLNLLGKSYDLISYDCEHYASYVQTGKVKDWQVSILFVLMLAALFIGIAIKN